MAQTHELGAAVAGPRSASRAPWLFSWPLVAGTLVYLYFFSLGNKLLQDSDTYWHIAAGQWIIRHGSVPTSDPFSHSMRGAPWTAQEWLSQVVLATAHDAGGWPFVIALTALAFGGTIALLTRALLKWLEPVYALMFAALAVVMTANHVLARPHVIAMPLLMVWMTELVRARDEDRRPGLWLLPVMAAWANLHGGFTLGIALAFAFAFEALVEAWKQRRLSIVVRSWGLFLTLTILASLVTPHGLQGIFFTWQVLVQDSYALARIGEWRSPDFHVFQPLELWLLGAMALALYQGLRLPPIRLVLLLGLLHLALKHIRSVELLGLLAPLIVAAPLAAQWRQRQQGRQQFELADRWFARLSQPAGQGALALCLGLVLLAPLWSLRGQPLELPESSAPTRAVRAAQQAGLTGNVLNTYGWGGYLIYLGIPPFIDGRSDVYRDNFIQQYVRAHELRTPDALAKLLEKYSITWTLLEPDSSAASMLDQMPGWRRVYADKTAVVHAKDADQAPTDPPLTNRAP